MEDASRTGAPVFRPLLYDYPEDPATWERDDEFLWGRDVLVAPVLREGVTDREVYLPKGDWFDFWTGTHVAGGRGIRIPVTLDHIPIFVREGAFVFRQPTVQHTGEMPGQPLIVSVYPAARSEASLYEDDFSPFCLIAESVSDADAIQKHLEAYCAAVPGLVLVRNDVYARFSHEAYNKGTALAEIARQLGVGRQNVFAAGDHLNDLSMLDGKFAACVAAPDNAVPEVKDLVRRQKGYVSHQPWGHGVARALEFFLDGR